VTLAIFLNRKRVNYARDMRADSVLIDRFVGRRIRERRVMLGMSQRQLGEPNGITVQQVFKYEHGQNAVTVSPTFRAGSSLRQLVC
jgi:ribosome-binding protein aMBF1 (putative translation factor)